MVLYDMPVGPRGGMVAACLPAGVSCYKKNHFLRIFQQDYQ
jgi:hypothetical protein